MNQIDLKGQHAIVTGGAQGLGFAMAKRIADSGARVTIWDLDDALAQEAKKALGPNAHAVKVDIADCDAVAGAHAASEKAGGPVSIVVNSAGIAGPTVSVDVYDPAWWRKIIDINLNGTFYVCRACVPSMKKQGYGRIVNIASIAGKEGNPNASAYSASKAGVIGFTKSLGK